MIIQRFFDGITPSRAFFVILGSVVLGALGNGVWFWLVEPSLGWSIRGAMSILTLGIDSLRDAVYVEIARGWSDSIDLLLLSILPAVAFAMALVSTTVHIWSRRDQSSGADDNARPSWWRYRAVPLLGMWLCAAPLLGITVFCVYVNDARLHFSQSLAIVAPYLDEHQEELVVSEFAQIETSGAYREVLRKLEEAAAESGVELPTFLIW